MIKWKTILYSSLLSLTLIDIQTVYAEESIDFCEDPWPPYTYGEMGAPPSKGYAVEFLNEIAARTNITVTMTLLPWKRCLLMAERGEMDGIMLLTKNDQRTQYLDFSIPVMSDNNLVWYRRMDNIHKKLDSFSDLKNYRIGLAASFNYGDEFEAAIKEFNLNVEVAHDIKSNFRKLALGRIDVFFVNLAVANEVFRQNPELEKNIVYSDKLFKKVPFFIAISKKSKARSIVPKLNQTIQTMAEDGTIDRILRAPL